jgi:hypothetical protein
MCTCYAYASARDPNLRVARGIYSGCTQIRGRARTRPCAAGLAAAGRPVSSAALPTARLPRCGRRRPARIAVVLYSRRPARARRACRARGRNVHLRGYFFARRTDGWRARRCRSRPNGWLVGASAWQCAPRPTCHVGHGSACVPPDGEARP